MIPACGQSHGLYYFSKWSLTRILAGCEVKGEDERSNQTNP